MLAVLLCSACHKKGPTVARPIGPMSPIVQLVQPEIRDLVRIVGQPSFIDSYEQTAIYAKLPGFILKWNVDIGDRVKKDDLLATLFIPELEQEYNLKKANTQMDRALVEQANKLVEVAEGNLQGGHRQGGRSQGRRRAIRRAWCGAGIRKSTGRSRWSTTA